jgi:glycosyltransferase involved in cell wall biosynthesis
MTNTKDLTLSIGIPTFNQADYLALTLDSLLTQTRPPDEIVVSDHYSTDHTQQVLARYVGRFPNLRIVQPPPGVNLTGQYNFTLSSLSGDWITLLSSDDIAYPNFCATLLAGAAADPAAVLVRAGWEHIDAQGKVLSTHYLLSAPASERPPKTLLTQKYGPKVNFAAFALKREAFLQSGPILPSLESLSDWALFLQMAPFGTFVYQHALISGYRVGHDGNKYRDRIPMWSRDMQRVFTEVIPLAAQRCGMTSQKDRAWIDSANTYNYTRYLARGSREYDPTPEARVDIVPLFHAWADSILSPIARASAHTALQAFALGQVTQTSIPPLRRLKTHLRPLLQRFHSILRRS